MSKKKIVGDVVAVTDARDVTDAGEDPDVRRKKQKQASKARCALRDRARVELSCTFDFGHGGIDAMIRDVLGCLRDDNLAFVVVEDVVAKLRFVTIRAWAHRLNKHGEGWMGIFDSKFTKDPMYEQKRQQSSELVVEDLPTELDFDMCLKLFNAMGFTLTGLKLLFSVGYGAKETVHQILHMDHGTPHNYWTNSPREGPMVTSVIISLHGMELDVWRTGHWYAQHPKCQVPTHPSSVPLITLRVPAGAMVMFRHDLLHAGRGYPKDNFRLFGTLVPHAGPGMIDAKTEDTFAAPCECQQDMLSAALSKARARHENANRHVLLDDDSEIVYDPCTCPARTSSGPSYEEWKKEMHGTPNNVFRMIPREGEHLREGEE